MFFSFPFKIDENGRWSTTNERDYIKGLIHQVLFTSPGERLNRPSFGCGLGQLIFEPNSDILSVSIDTIVQSALSSWLNHLITVEAVDVYSKDSSLEVTVKYTIRKTEETFDDNFKREL